MKDLHGSATTAIEATPEHCIAVLAAVDRYPTWYPDVVRDVEVLERDDAGMPRRARTTTSATLSKYGVGPMPTACPHWAVATSEQTSANRRAWLPGGGGPTLVSATAEKVVLRIDGVDRPFDVARCGGDIFVDSPDGCVQLTVLPRFPEPGSALQPGSLVAPMPGAVSRLGAAVGDTVTAGQPLVWLEAMKMEHAITAPKSGVLAELAVALGQQVELGAVLARVQSAETSTEEESHDE